MFTTRHRFLDLCRRGSREGNRPNPLSPPRFSLDERDLTQFFEGVNAGLISLEPMARFNTLDRPRRGGRWGLLSFFQSQTTINGEYLPQLAAYVDLVRRLGFHTHRVLFEPGESCRRVDLAVMDDQGQVLVLGEAKVASDHPNDLIDRITAKHAACPTSSNSRPPGRGRAYEAWKLADAMWRTQAPYLWLVAPGVRLAFGVEYAPLRLLPLSDLPSQKELGLAPELHRFVRRRDYC